MHLSSGLTRVIVRLVATASTLALLSAMALHSRPLSAEEAVDGVLDLSGTTITADELQQKLAGLADLKELDLSACEEVGDAALAHELHNHGYAGVRERHPVEAQEEQDARDSSARVGAKA